MSSGSRPVVLNLSEGHPTSWRWFEGRIGHTTNADALDWRFFHSKPRNRLERIRKPAVVRYTEAARAAFAARTAPASLVVSHGPLASWLYEEAARFTRARAPHLAFSFNFTELPRGLRHQRMRAVFDRIDRFVVFSTLERSIYADYFGIPEARIDMIHWGVNPPGPSDAARAEKVAPYVSAIGGNARDYRTLLAAARATPEVQYRLVVRPENLAGVSLPPNVQAEVNVPIQRAWDITFQSRFMVLPLLHSEVPCGHVTIVNAMHLGKGLVITDSRGIHDYTVEGETALRVPAGDPEAMAAAVRKLWNDPALADRLGQAGQRFADEHCTEAHTARWVQRYFASKGLPS
jgi:glycosyltransferase involved in cell wall biosynthesis